MKHIKKLFLAVVCVGVFQNIFAYDEWNGWRSIELGETQQLSTTKTLTQSLYIAGTLILYPSGVLNSSTYTLTNNGYINVWGGTLNLNGGTLNNGFSASETGTIQVGSGSVGLSSGNFYNGYSGSGTITVTGGSFNPSGAALYNAYGANSIGCFNLNGGTVGQSAGTFYNGNGANSLGTVTILTGTWNQSGSAIFDNGYSSTGNMIITNGYMNWSSSGNFYNAYNGSVPATLTLSGTWNQTAGYFYNGYSLGSTGTVTVDGGKWIQGSSSDFYNGNSGNGTFNLQGGTVSGWGRFRNSNGSSSLGILNINGGTYTQLGALSFRNGYVGTGNVNLNGGVFNYFSSEIFYNGDSVAASRGYITINGGTWNHGGGIFYNGNVSGARGELTINDGIFTMTAGEFDNGYTGTGYVTLSNTATFSFASSSGFYNGRNSGATGFGRVTVNGGRWTHNTGSFSNGYNNGTLAQSTLMGELIVNGGEFEINTTMYNGRYAVGRTFINGGTYTQNVGSFYNDYYNSGSSYLAINGGVLNWNSSSHFYNGYADRTYQTDGNVDLYNGEFNWNGSGNFYNAYDIWGSGYLRIYDGTFNFRNGQFYNGYGGNYNNGGQVRVIRSGGKFNYSSASSFFNGYCNVSGAVYGYFYLDNGEFNWNSAATFYNGYTSAGSGYGSFYINGGKFNSGNAGTFRHTSGGSGYVYLYGASGYTGASDNLFYANSGTVNMPEGATFIVGSNKTLGILTTFTYGGEIDNSSGGTFNLFTSNAITATNSTITVASGKTLNLSSYTLTISAGRTVDVQKGGSFNYNGGLVNNGTFNLYGTPAYTPNSTTLTTSVGSYEMSGGTLTVGSGRVLNNLDGGTWTLWPSSVFSVVGTMTNNSVMNVFGGTLNLSGGNFYNGYSVSETGTIYVGAGTVGLSSGTLYNGNNGSGTITVTGGSVNPSGATIYSANGANSLGYFNLNGGTVGQSAGTFYNGYGANSLGAVNILTGTWNQSGSAEFDNGYSSTGNMTIAGGTMNWGSTGAFYNARNGSVPATLALDGGTWNHNGSGGFYNGYTLNSTGTVTIDGGGTWNRSAGIFANGYSGYGTLNLLNGVFNSNSGSSWFANGSGSMGRGFLTIDGGTWNQWAGAGSFYNADAGMATFVLQSGTFNYFGTNSFYHGQGSAARGTVTINGGAFNYGGSGTLYQGYTSGGRGELTMNDGTFTMTAGEFDNGYSGTGYVTLSNTATFSFASSSGFYSGRNSGATAFGRVTVNGGKWLHNGGYFHNGYNAGTRTDTYMGELIVNGGEFEARVPMYNGDTGADGLLLLNGGTYNQNAGEFYNGNFSPKATLVINGGVFNHNSGSNFYNGQYGGLDSTVAYFYLNGGEFNWNSAARFYHAGGIASGHMHIRGGKFNSGNAGTFSYNSGSYVYLYGASGYTGASDNNFLANSGTVNMPEGATFIVGSNKTLGILTTFTYGGEIDNSSGGMFNLFTSNAITATNSTITVASGKTLNLSSYTLTISAGRTVDVQKGGSFNYNGGLVNNGTFNLYGTPAYTPNSTTLTTSVGSYEMSGGTLTVGSGRVLNNLDGGTWTLGPSSVFSVVGTMTNNSVMNVFGGTLNLSGGELYNGYSVSETGTIYVGAGTVGLSSGTFYNGNNGSGTVTVTGGSFNPSGANIYSANGANSLGYFNLNGGSVGMSAGVLRSGIGVNSLGTMNIAGGTWNQTGGVFSNGYTSTGNMTISSGAMNWGSSGNYFYNAYSGSVPATLTINGGTWNHNAGNFSNGSSGNGTLNLLAGALNWNSSDGWFYNATYANSSGVINVDGGTWTKNAGNFDNGHSGMGTINLNSGTWNNGGGLFCQGYWSGGRGEFTINDGTFTMTGGEFDNGYSGTGYVTLNGGAVNYSSGSSFYNGRSADTTFGRVTINGGTWNQQPSFSNGCYYDAYYKLTYIGEFILNGGTFNSNGTFYNGSSRKGAFIMNGGTYNQNASGFYNGLYSQDNVNMFLKGGVFNYNSGGTFYNGYTDSGTYYCSGNLLLRGGEFNWNSAATFYNGYDSNSANYGQGHIIITRGKFNSGNAGTFTYQGTVHNFNLCGASGVLNSSNYFYANSGTVNMPSDATFIVGSNKTLNIAATFTYGGNIDNSSGGIFYLMGYPLAAADRKITVASGKTLYLATYGLTIGPSNSVEVQPGANFNFGTTLMNNGSFNLYGAQAFTPNSTTITTSFGTCDIGGGTLTIASGRTLNISDGTSFNYYGTLTKNGLFTLYGTYPSFASQTMTFTSGQNAYVSPGTYLGVGAGNTVAIASGGSLIIPSTAGFKFYGNVDEQTGGTFNLFGSTITTALNSLTVDAGQTCALDAGGFFGIGPSRTITVPSTAIFTIPSTASFDYSGDVNEQSGGAFSLFGATASTASKKIIIDAGQTCAPGVGTLFTIGNGNTLVLSNGSLFDISGGFNVAGNIDTSAGGLFSLYGATVTPTTNKFTINSGQRCVLDAGVTFTLGAGKTLVVPVGAELLVDTGALFKNLSSSTLDIYDTTKVVGVLENGDLTNAGIINIYYPGSLIIPGGTVSNKNAYSTIKVERGGSILNYGGILDLSMGTCTVNPGGLVSNEAGSFNYDSSKITFSMGAVFNERDYIALSKDFDLDFTWTITVPSIIRGNGKCLNFVFGGALQINPGASLLLKDVVLNGVNTNNIRCMDNTGTLSLKNVIWMQDGNYSFTQGAIDFVGDVIIEGPATQFGYASTMTSTIHHNASLLFDNQTTFSYLASSPTLLVMEDKSSVLAFDNAALFAEQDMRLACGTILFDNGVTLSPDTGKTIYFGDKTNHPGDANYDVDIDMLAAVNVAVYGNVVIDNVTA